MKTRRRKHRGPPDHRPRQGLSPRELRELQKSIAGEPRQAQQTCGECTLCCRLVPVVELGLKAFQGCPHERNVPFTATPGCAIYSTRPHACRIWNCQFLIEGWADEYRPSRCGVVVDTLPDLIRIVPPGTPEHLRKEIPAVQMWVAPGFEDAYQRQPVLALVLASIATVGAVVWRIKGKDGVGQAAIGLFRDAEGKLVATDATAADVDFMPGRSTEERLALAELATSRLPSQR
jgi:hypothetical protein